MPSLNDLKNELFEGEGTLADKEYQYYLNGGILPGHGTFLEDSGIPEGVVTASPGALYSDTAITRGAALWRKASGTGNTGWVVVSGDTGWRTITSWTSAGVVSGEPLSASWSPNPETAGRIMVKRTADSVYVHVVTLRRIDTANIPVWASYALPVGFRPNAFIAGFVPTGTSVTGLTLATDGVLSRLTGNASAANGTMDIVTLEGPAITTWPSTLPGSPA